MSQVSTVMSECVDNFNALTKAKAFLGREFLTWLWARTEASENTIEISNSLGEKVTCRLWVDDRVVLESNRGSNQSSVLKGGDPGHSPEAAAALQAGKSVRELKLGLHAEGEGDFTAILASDGLSQDALAPRSLQLPVPEENQTEAPLPRRIRQVGIYLTAVDTLFAEFIAERIGSGWSTKGLRDLQKWMQKKRPEALLH